MAAQSTSSTTTSGTEKQAPEQANASWLSCVGLGGFSQAYDLSFRALVRPPRAEYGMEELGPTSFRARSMSCVREEFELQGGRGTLQCSHFRPANTWQGRPCVVFAHGNASCRVQALEAAQALLPLGVSVVAPDLSGSGMSDGEFISLGWFESEDLGTVMDYLETRPDVTTIGLWGRSMGAATCVLRASQDSRVGACVLDSCYTSVNTIVEDAIEKLDLWYTSYLAVSWMFYSIKSEIKTRAGFDLAEVNPLEKAPLAKCPGFFVVAVDDTLVLPEHTQRLHDAWGGNKVMAVDCGGHMDERSGWIVEEAADFLASELGPPVEESYFYNSFKRWLAEKAESWAPAPASYASNCCWAPIQKLIQKRSAREQPKGYPRYKLPG